MKTIQSWLETLPEPFRTQALNNLDTSYGDQIAETIYEAIGGAFTWAATPEGLDYWDDLYNSLVSDTEKPKVEVDPNQEWQAALANMAVHGHKNGFLNENGLRTINFVFDNTIFEVIVRTAPNNIITGLFNKKK